MFFKKKQLTVLEILQQELKWLHTRSNSTHERDDAYRLIEKIHTALIQLAVKDYESETQKKIKDLQETVGEMLLLDNSNNKNV